jgi:hypothetical protein
VFDEQFTVLVPIGGYKKGDTIEQNTSLTDVLKKLLTVVVKAYIKQESSVRLETPSNATVEYGS